MIRQYELVEAVKEYDPGADEELLNRAYIFAMQVHGTQERASGDLYFTHPLEVAGILVGLRLDVTTIATALLHDTVEDTSVTLQEIEKLFGKEIAFLVDGMTKLSQIKFQSDQIKQAENFRKLLLAMSSDIRVLLIKLADRLHNMRTLQYIKSDAKKKRIATETMEIYAPLAERIGLHTIKDELQNLAFFYLHPHTHHLILAQLHILREQGTSRIEPIVGALNTTLKKNGIKATIAGREKTPYSIWRKMQEKNISFENLFDIIAFRIIVESVPECYSALGAIHTTYSFIPGRFKDYNSTPKQNNYKSIHTSVIGPNQQRIEVQIRTQEMEKVSELGVAAHWQYKQGISHEGQQYPWLRSLLDIQRNTLNPKEFLEDTKLEMFQDQVFCFTPKGDLITLPRGAIAIDFAYAVHSNIGDHCTAARINGFHMSLHTPLANGDQVDIITSSVQSPSPTWVRFVKTGKARASIRRFLRHQKFIEIGQAALEEAFEKERLVFNEKKIKSLLKALKEKSLAEIYAQIGEGLKSPADLILLLYPNHKLTHLTEKTSSETHRTNQAPSRLPQDIPTRFSSCCHPIPGDPIVGILTPSQKKITIHADICKTLDQFMDSPKQWVEAEWDKGLQNAKNHTAHLVLTVEHAPGSMAAIATLIAQHHANILDLKVTNKRPEFYDLKIDLNVNTLTHLQSIIDALRLSPHVMEVERK